MRTGKSLDPETPCVVQSLGTLNSPPLKDRTRNPLAPPSQSPEAGLGSGCLIGLA